MREEMLEFVKQQLEATGGEGRGKGNFSFRKRSEHIRRVYAWARRLIIENNFDNVDADAVLTAALFHDAGYTRDSDARYHAAQSADLYAKYAREHGVDPERARVIEQLVRDHSRKDLMKRDDTPIELVLLMEADLLDESGAMSVVWDCLAEGASERHSFESALAHLNAYSGRMTRQNYMKTPAAVRIWNEKAALVEAFIKNFAKDIEFGI